MRVRAVQTQKLCGAPATPLGVRSQLLSCPSHLPSSFPCGCQSLPSMLDALGFLCTFPYLFHRWPMFSRKFCVPPQSKSKCILSLPPTTVLSKSFGNILLTIATASNWSQSYDLIKLWSSDIYSKIRVMIQWNVANPPQRITSTLPFMSCRDPKLPYPGPKTFYSFSTEHTWPAI